MPYVGMMFMVISLTMIVPGLYSVIVNLAYGEDDLVIGVYLLVWGGFTFVVGSLMAAFGRGPSEELKPYESVLLTILVWLAIPVYESIAFMSLLQIPFVDAMFEITSAWTTTGLTVLTGGYSPAGGYVPAVEELSRSILLWRSMIQWVGGLGIVVFTIALLARPGISVAQLYLAEGKFEKLEPSFKRTAYKMAIIYVFITLIAIVFFVEAGMPLFDGINHAMTGVATAGFSVKNGSIGEYGSTAIKIAAALSMVMGAISFADWRNIFMFRFREVLRSVELRAQFILWGLASLSAISSYYWARHIPGSLVDALFQVFSASSTGGFQTIDIGAAPREYVFMLSVMMMIGGSAFSTAGGIKVYRVVIAAKVAVKEVRDVFSPRGSVYVLKVGRTAVRDEVIRKSLAVIFSYIAAWIVSTIILGMILPTEDLGNMLFETSSALTNTGLSSGISSAVAPTAAKILLTLDMLFGRLEIMTYLAVLYGILYRMKVKF